MYERTLELLDRYALAFTRVNREVPAEDHVAQHDKNIDLYLYNGGSALRAMINALVIADRPLPQSFLDFGCAFGRITRFVHAAFPETALTVSDVRLNAIEYCAKTFGADPVPSSPDIRQVRFPRQHDLIWCGSVATHLPEDVTRDLLELLTANLKPGGLLCCTLHGRIYPQEVQPKLWKILEPAAFDVALREYEESGYGYHDYPGRPGIGASLTSPSWVFDWLYPRSDLTMIWYGERAWMGWHDLVVIQKKDPAAKGLFGRYGVNPF